MNQRTILGALVCFTAILGQITPAEAATPPLIKHQPATVAVQGQSLSIKASVTGTSRIKSVQLFYSTSKDVAPFKVDMQPTGPDVYIGAIAPNLLKAARQVTYYIEATDSADASSETPWYTVSIQSPGSAGAAQTEPAPEEESSWTTPLLIGGGVLLIGGGAAAIGAMTSKKSGGSDDDPASDTEGIYVGSVTITFEVPGQPPVHDTHGATLTIADDGAVSSADLHTGATLTGKLTGSDFALTATLTGTNQTGQVTYNGTVANGRINGSVGGAAQTAAGSGTYYGTFYAVRQ